MAQKIDRRAWLLKIFLLSTSLLGVLMAIDQLGRKNVQVKAVTGASASSTAGE